MSEKIVFDFGPNWIQGCIDDTEVYNEEQMKILFSHFCAHATNNPDKNWIIETTIMSQCAPMANLKQMVSEITWPTNVEIPPELL